MHFGPRIMCGLAPFLVIAVLAAAPSVLAEDDTPAATPSVTVADVDAVASATTNAEVVPVQGGVTPAPDAEQRVAMTDALAAALNRSQEGMVDVVLPNGSVMRDLRGGFQTAIVMRVAPDGSVTTDCVTSLEAMKAPRAPVAAPRTTATTDE